MTRPSKEQVDKALEDHGPVRESLGHCCVLAAEVLALRAQLADAKKFNERAMVLNERSLAVADNSEALIAELDQLRALRMLVIAYKRDCDSENVDPYDARCEMFDAL